MNSKDIQVVLDEVRDYLDDHVDVLDGDDGQPRPNRAMSLTTEIDRLSASLARAELRDATVVTDLLKVVEMLMPGVRSIAVPDYALLNDAPLRARQWLGERAVRP